MTSAAQYQVDFISMTRRHQALPLARVAPAASTRASVRPGRALPVPAAARRPHQAPDFSLALASSHLTYVTKNGPSSGFASLHISRNFSQQPRGSASVRAGVQGAD